MREKHCCERETSISCLLHAPWLGTKPTTQHVPWLEMEPMIFWFAGRWPTNWATPARTFCSFLNQIICFLQIWVVWVPYILMMLALYHIRSLQLFSPAAQAAFSFCWSFLLLCRSFIIWCSPTYFSLLSLMLLVLYPKMCCQNQCQGAFPLWFLLGVIYFGVLY